MIKRIIVYISETACVVCAAYNKKGDLMSSVIILTNLIDLISSATYVREFIRLPAMMVAWFFSSNFYLRRGYLQIIM